MTKKMITKGEPLVKFVKLRKKLGLTQPELAAEIGVSLSTLQRVELGVISPDTGRRFSLDLDTVAKLHKFLVAKGAQKNLDLRNIDIFDLFNIKVKKFKK